MDDPMAMIRQGVEEYGSRAFDAGFTAGKNAATQPWQNIEAAPKDGTSLLLGVGTMRCIGHWSNQKNSWVQQGTGRAVLPSFFMHVPVIPGVNKRVFVPRETGVFKE